MRAIPEITDARIAFGCIDHMPKYSEVPDEFKHGETKWNRLVSDMFFSGLSDLSLIPKEGVDPKKAFRAVQAILSSWEPKHEHKEAGAAFLLSEWFEDATWTKAA